MSKVQNKEKGQSVGNAFMGAADVLGAGVDALFGGAASDDFEIVVNLDDVEIRAQHRTELEDEANSLQDLADSLKVRQIQAIVLNANPAGSAMPYRLVAGERRVRAARIAGLDTLRARVYSLTDDEVDQIQFAENTQRKNLTQLELARKVQADLDKLGSVEAVLAKHNKSRAWLSKVVGLLDLPEQASALVAENISADVEVIHAVKAIEKVDPERAKKVVQELREGRGKVNQRERVQQVKNEVKPKAVPKDKPTKPKTAPAAAPAPAVDSGEGFAGANIAVLDVLEKTYSNIVEFGSVPQTIWDVMQPAEREVVADWLRDAYDAGRDCKSGQEVAAAMFKGVRDGALGTEGVMSFATAAFLFGCRAGATFEPVAILASVKP